MADLRVSYDYLDELVGTLTQVAGRIRLDDTSASVDHSVTESASVETAGDEILKFQTVLSSLLADNMETLAASVSDASATMSEADKSLATDSSSDGS